MFEESPKKTWLMTIDSTSTNFFLGALAGGAACYVGLRWYGLLKYPLKKKVELTDLKKPKMGNGTPPEICFLKLKSNERPFRIEKTSLAYDPEVELLTFNRIRADGHLEFYQVPHENLEFCCEVPDKNMTPES